MSITNPKRPFCINTKDAKKTRMRGKKTRSRRELLNMVQFDKSQRSYQNFTDRIKSKAIFTYYDSSLDYFLHNCKIESYDDLCALQGDAIQEKLQDFCRHEENITPKFNISKLDNISNSIPQFFYFIDMMKKGQSIMKKKPRGVGKTG